MPNRPLKPDVLAEDLDTLTAILAIPDYAPSNPAFTKTELTAAVTAHTAAHEARVNAENALAAARDAEVAAQYGVHSAALGGKDQVTAQYGPDSDEVQSLGLKKKSERKRPKPREKKT